MNPNLESSAHEAPRAVRPRRLHTPGTQGAAVVDASAACAVERLRQALDEAVNALQSGADAAHCACPEFASRVRAALTQAAAEDALLTPAQREGAVDGYRRHVLVADPRGRYAAAALVWQPGQASPVHAHHTWCGYAVLDGVLTETLYAWNEAARCATRSRAQPREAGAVSYGRAGLNAIHRLGNESARPAVSLHIYGVSSERFATHVNRLISAECEPARNEH